jgi:hypothetical protein
MSPHPPITRRSVQGRRPSVSPTTVRRSRSARRRPGAGPLPSWRPAARVLKRSTSVEHFRIYSEEEFFAATEQTPAECDPSDPAAGSAQLVGHAVSGRTPRRSLRTALACVSLLGAIGALPALILASLSATAGHRARRGVLRAAQPDPKRSSRGPLSLGVRPPNERRARPRATRTPGIGRSSSHSPRLRDARSAGSVDSARSPHLAAMRHIGGSAAQPSRREVDVAIARPVRSATPTEFGFER